jgi:ADP-ribosyl-[dinitrogen reductase] hydrolase
MLLEAAIGDAYGAAFEFTSRAFITEKNTLTRYEAHPKYPNRYKRYTDDTQMTLALSELLLEDRAWTPAAVADAFVRAYQRDPREGYSGRVQKALTEAVSGEDFLRIIPSISEGNGSAMRAHPIGLLPDEQAVMDKAALQAAVTHNTESGIRSAQAIALTSHYFIYKKGPKAKLLEYLFENQGYRWRGDWEGEVRVNGPETVESVLTVLLQTENLCDALIKSVNFGGDVDTVASLALALGSGCDEIENNLPGWLYTDLENGPYGFDYLQNINKKLFGESL